MTCRSRSHCGRTCECCVGWWRLQRTTCHEPCMCRRPGVDDVTFCSLLLRKTTSALCLSWRSTSRRAANTSLPRPCPPSTTSMSTTAMRQTGSSRSVIPVLKVKVCLQIRWAAFGRKCALKSWACKLAFLRRGRHRRQVQTTFYYSTLWIDVRICLNFACMISFVASVDYFFSISFHANWYSTALSLNIELYSFFQPISWIFNFILTCAIMNGHTSALLH